LSSEPGVLQASGSRVWVATVRQQDIAPYRRAVEQSRARLSRWNPVDLDDLARALPLQSGDRRTFLVHALTPEGDHDIVGKINLSDVVRGRFESAAMGYDAYDPYAGRGLFAEGLRLVVNLLFTPREGGGVGLHRVQAAVQPGNVRSAGLLRSLGFQREGFSPRMLWLPGADGVEAWRDHHSYVVIADEWPAQPYRPSSRRRAVALVNGMPGCGAAILARQLAGELGVPLFSQEAASSTTALWRLVADSPVGGVVEGFFSPGDAGSVAAGLSRAGLDPTLVCEVWCLPVQAVGSAGPLGLGPTLTVDTAQRLGTAEVVRLALQVAAGPAPTSAGPW
jgi:ribosomal-protein-alanine N-acetyltransferase